MHPTTAELVRHTWSLILPERKQVCARFYERLFEVHPELRPLFKGDLARQTGLFVTMINTVISAVDDTRPVRPLLQTLGARHAEYGVPASAYAKFEVVLLDTLTETLGDSFSPAARAAWAQVFEDLAAIMQAGAVAAEAADVGAAHEKAMVADEPRGAALGRR